MPSPPVMETDAPARTARVLRRGTWLLAIYLGFLAVAAAAIRARLPMPAHYDLDDKLRYFLEHKDEYDLVFAGSSATFRNYVPEVIDAELAQAGLDVRSYNFGIVGFRSFETDFFIKWILDQEPKRLKWMVIEPPAFEPPFDYGAIQASKSELAVHSHTPEETALIVRSVRLADLPWRTKVSETWRHLKLGAMNLGNIGRGPASVRQALTHDPDWTAPRWLVEGQGFQAVEDRPGWEEPAVNPLGDRATYRANAIAMEAKNRATHDLSRYNRAGLRRQVEVLRDHGVEPIYALSPMVHQLPYVLALDAEGELPNLMAFHLPQTYPGLFVYEERMDLTHYRRAGAERFSRFLAPRLAEILRATGP